MDAANDDCRGWKLQLQEWRAHGRSGAPALRIRAKDQPQADLLRCERSHFRGGGVGQKDARPLSPKRLQVDAYEAGTSKAAVAVTLCGTSGHGFSSCPTSILMSRFTQQQREPRRAQNSELPCPRMPHLPHYPKPCTLDPNYPNYPNYPVLPQLPYLH